MDTTNKRKHPGDDSEALKFEFGANWARFLRKLDESRIEAAKKSLREMLESDSLEGRSFLDIGSGSGLFSLAARMLGARVHSFDYDKQSVECTAELRRRYFPEDDNWKVGRGSVLDSQYLGSLGCFDVVYSWGVLHHTGSMWEAMENVSSTVKDGGLLFISIYNDQGVWSNRWKRIKYFYNRLPSLLRPFYTATVMGIYEMRYIVTQTFKLKLFSYVKKWTEYDTSNSRGMSLWHDWVDWVGGYPFEVAKPEEVFDFYRERGFSLNGLKTCGGGSGCNQFVFKYQGQR